jgi:hypothetical protein
VFEVIEGTTWSSCSLIEIKQQIIQDGSSAVKLEKVSGSRRKRCFAETQHGANQRSDCWHSRLVFCLRLCWILFKGYFALLKPAAATTTYPDDYARSQAPAMTFCAARAFDLNISTMLFAASQEDGQLEHPRICSPAVAQIPAPSSIRCKAKHKQVSPEDLPTITDQHLAHAECSNRENHCRHFMTQLAPPDTVRHG